MILIQMAGFPGSGKSTVSKELASRLNAVVIDKDILKTSLLEFDLDNDVSSRLAYKLMFDLADFHLSLNQSVILDTPCYYEEILDTGKSIADKYQADYKFVECKVEDFEIIEDRILKRNNKVSQIKSVKKETFTHALDKTKHPDEHFILDTSNLHTLDYVGLLAYLNK